MLINTSNVNNADQSNNKQSESFYQKSKKNELVKIEIVYTRLDTEMINQII